MNFYGDQRFFSEPRKVDFSRPPRIRSGERKQPRPLTNDAYAANEVTEKQVCFASHVSSRFYENQLSFQFPFCREEERVFGGRGEKEVSVPFGRREFSPRRGVFREQLGGGRRLHVDKRVTKMVQLNVDIQRDTAPPGICSLDNCVYVLGRVTDDTLCIALGRGCSILHARVAGVSKSVRPGGWPRSYVQDAAEMPFSLRCRFA